MSDTRLTFRGALAEVRLIAGCGRDVWRLIPTAQRWVFAAAAGLVVGMAGLTTAFTILLGRLVDALKPAGGVPADAQLRAAGGVLALIAGVYLLRVGADLLRRYLVEGAVTRMEQRLLAGVIDRLLRADLGTFGQDKIGALQGRITRSVVGTLRFIRLTLLDLLPPFLTGAFAIATVLSQAPVLAAVMAAIAPVSIGLTLRQIASQKGVRLHLIRAREDIDGTVVELLGGIDYIRAAHTEAYELARVGASTEHLRAVEKGHHVTMALFGSARAVVEGFFQVLVLGTAAYLAVHGHISHGQVLTFFFLFMSVMAPLNEVHRFLDEGHECSLRVRDLLDMLARRPDPSFAPAAPVAPVVAAGEPLVAADHLVVEYPTLAGPKRALDGVSLAIRHGETVGLVGPSGCGKTTLLRVLLRLTPPTGGRVCVGGVPLGSVSRERIGHLVGYVGQNPFVFHGTIAENIAYGVADATPDQIAEAARRANIHDDILDMPGGYTARVAERGANLSGGQRQRIALARVFLKNPPVLILDEGTSALDTISERKVQAAIAAARADRTVILVAHRLSTLKDADRILVFEDGKVVQQGAFAELAERDGVFADLVRSSDLGGPPPPPVRVAMAG